MSVDTAQEALEPLPERDGYARADTAAGSAGAVDDLTADAPPRRRAAERLRAFAPAVERLRWPLAVYLSSRVLYFLVAVIGGAIQHWSLKAEMSNWDGVWYRRLAGLGYPNHIPNHQSPLGFFPLYPMLMWLVQHALLCSIFLAGAIVAGIGGFIATVLVERLSAGWWGEEASRRAVVFFCFFPGSIVFSMDYSEGILIPLIAGALIALERRRWLLAGILAAFATAVGPPAVAIIPACAVAALIELRRRGWRDSGARKSLIAPLLAPVGLIAFGAFLWAWVGTPFATFDAQHYPIPRGWGERTDPLAIYNVALRLAREIERSFLSHINLNYVSGIVGAAFLLTALVLLVKTRPRIPAPALVWTLGIGFLTVTSENVPPNPRLLITAFPAVLVVAYRLKGWAFYRLIAASTTLLIVMTAVSYVGTGLRP